ncbi:IS110 family transposase [Prevotella communis]|jgi:transposase|uniref:Transposase n=1 Tax=Prevotella communis TaxID=2913614 RepID=A0A1G7W9E9_9BACT|nr:IS110 family transposase [Prevotella communis]UKK55812.1 IS110 family transposase [Prevotella communis]UKK55923.1 IS110 family transposase [Prevotella communis]UKK57975.1 IS110 family transposase [Prevotella communis]UKK58240.1 IS110 family transposase [Prevotella communis]UKK58929.1 IS110 family transposase [Prevotella communis]
MKKIFIGIDVSKKTIDASVIIPSMTGDKPSLQVYGKFDNRPSGFRKMVAMVRKAAAGIDTSEWTFCCETTGGYDIALCDYITSKQMIIWREHAAEIAKIRRDHGKDDRRDSLLIAEYAWRNQDKTRPYTPKNVEILNLRHLLLYRRQLVEMRKQLVVRSNELKQIAENCEQLKFMYKDSQKLIKEITERIENCEVKMRELMSTSPTIAANFSHIISITGIGLVSTAAILIYTNNFIGITSYKKFASYCGIAPFYEDSGTTVHKRDYIGHKSNSIVRTYLTQAAQVASRFNVDMVEYKQRMALAGKPQQVIIINIANKLLRIVFSVIKNDCDYEPRHEYMRQQRIAQEKTVA